MMELPPFENNFNHSVIRELSTGPRREATLLLHPLVWVGDQGHFGYAIRVRFGGITNVDEVNALFATYLQVGGELAWICYDRSRVSKPGCLFFHLECERVEAGVTIQCCNIDVEEVSPPLPYDRNNAALRPKERIWRLKKHRR